MMTRMPLAVRRLEMAAGTLAAAGMMAVLPSPGAFAAPRTAVPPTARASEASTAALPQDQATLQARTVEAADGSLSGCTKASTAAFPQAGMLENPASPRTAGWFTSGTWGGDVKGGLCLESVRMHVHDTTNALRTWEVTADGTAITSVSLRTVPGYHYWTFDPSRKLGRVYTLCIGVTAPETPGHAGKLAAEACYGMGWLA